MTPVRPALAVWPGVDARDRVGPPSDFAVAALDGESRSTQGGRSAIFDAAQTVRGFGRAFSELPIGFADQVEVDRRWHWRPAPGVWSALQHAAHFADLLAGIGGDLSFLLDGGGRVRFGLRAGPGSVSNDLDPDVVLEVLAGDAERVARLLEASPADPGAVAAFPAPDAVVMALADKAMSNGASALGAAHDALTRAGAVVSPPPAAAGRPDDGSNRDTSRGHGPIPDPGVVPISPRSSTPVFGIRRRCLVIDDAEDARFLLGLVLARAGYDVVAEAATASAGLDLAATAVPDVVLVDFVLPDADDGLATVAALRVVLVDAVIVVCSARSADDMESACLAAGADGYLEKLQLAEVGAVLGRLVDAARPGAAPNAVVSTVRTEPPPGGGDDQMGAWTQMSETGTGDGGRVPVAQRSKLADSLADMAWLLFDEVALESLLQLIVSLARSTLDAADEASVSVVHAGVFETITATSTAVRDLDHVQYQSGRGPCVAATRIGQRVTTGFDDETSRWPEFAQAGLAQGFAGVLAIPLTVGTRRLGAVNLYSRTHSTFAEADADAAQVFADHAAVAVANAVSFFNARVLNESLGDALKTRDLTGLAKGILMNRYGFSPAEAFDALRRDSKRRNTTLGVLAQEIIDSGQAGRHGQDQR